MCLGFSCCLLIGNLTLWGGLPLSDLTRLSLSEILGFWSAPLLFALGLSLMSVLLKKTPPTKRFLQGLSLVSATFIVIGYALLYVPKELATSSSFALPAALSFGVGYGLLLLFWLHQLSQFSDAAIVKTLLISLGVTSVSYLMIHPLLPTFSGIVSLVVICLSIIFCLICTSFPASTEELPLFATTRKSAGTAEKPVFKQIILELRDPLFCVSAIAVAVSLTRFIALDALEDSSWVNTAESISSIIAAFVLYVVMFGFGKSKSLFGTQNIPWLYRVFFPVIATALLLLSIFGSSLGLIVTTLAYVTFSIVSVFIMSTSITVARKYHVWPPSVYGIFAGCMYFVFMLATSIGPLVYYPQNFGSATFTIIVLIVLYILAMSYVAVQNRKRKNSVDVDGLDPSSLSFGTESAGVTSEGTRVAGDAEPETTIVDEVAQRCSMLSDSHQLTPREQDVLLLIARGRDVPSISKQLFISENTVRSHSKSVYKKLDIHSKQELIDLIESITL